MISPLARIFGPTGFAPQDVGVLPFSWSVASSGRFPLMSFRGYGLLCADISVLSSSGHWGGMDDSPFGEPGASANAGKVSGLQSDVLDQAWLRSSFAEYRPWKFDVIIEARKARSGRCILRPRMSQTP